MTEPHPTCSHIFAGANKKNSKFKKDILKVSPRDSQKVSLKDSLKESLKEALEGDTLKDNPEQLRQDIRERKTEDKTEKSKIGRKQRQLNF